MELLNKLKMYKTQLITIKILPTISLKILNMHAPIKFKYVRANQIP